MVRFLRLVAWLVGRDSLKRITYSRKLQTEEFLVRNATGKTATGTSQLSEQQASPLISARVLRLLKQSIIAMTFLIAAGLVALVYGMKQQMNKLATKAPVAEQVNFSLPKGAVLRTIAAADEAGSIWLHLDVKDEQPLLLLINAQGKLVRTLSLK